MIYGNGGKSEAVAERRRKVLAYVNDDTRQYYTREIAEALGVSRQVIKQDLYRLRKAGALA